MTNDQIKVLASLGERGPMENSRYFVGRDEYVLNLINCTEGEARSPAWIYGARRIGKSSIAKELERRAITKGTSTYWIDAINITTFEKLIKVTLDVANFHINTEKSLSENFEDFSLLSYKRPILLIYDEFDRVGMSLRTEQQGLLRKLSQINRMFSYIFITHKSPELLIEEVPDINSRILGICNQKHIYPLLERDIRELFDLVCEDLKYTDTQSCALHIWEKVGGYSVAVMTMMRSIASAIVCRKTLDDDDLDEIYCCVRSEISGDLSSYWWDLNNKSRFFILNNSCEAWAFQDGNANYLLRDGIVYRKRIHTPTWLSETGCRLGLTKKGILSDEGDSFYSKITNVHSLISQINDTARLKGLLAPFDTGESLKYFWLLREPCNELNFKAAIEHLYMVFYEGTSKLSSRERIYRFPDEIASTYKGAKVIGDISDIRNFFLHKHANEKDIAVVNLPYKEAGTIFFRYCGEAAPYEVAMWKLIKERIIDEIIVLLEEISQKLKIYCKSHTN